MKEENKPGATREEKSFAIIKGAIEAGVRNGLFSLEQVMQLTGAIVIVEGCVKPKTTQQNEGKEKS